MFHNLLRDPFTSESKMADIINVNEHGKSPSKLFLKASLYSISFVFFMLKT